MFNKTYEVRLTYYFLGGGRPKTDIYRIKEKNSDRAIIAAKAKFYDSIGYPLPDGKLEISYCRV